MGPTLRRAAAMAVDLASPLAAGAVGYGLVALAAGPAEGWDAFGVAIAGLLAAAVVWSVATLMIEVVLPLRWRATPGERLFGLMLVDTGTNPRFGGRLLLRACGRLVVLIASLSIAGAMTEAFGESVLGVTVAVTGSIALLLAASMPIGDAGAGAIDRLSRLALVDNPGPSSATSARRAATSSALR